MSTSSQQLRGSLFQQPLLNLVQNHLITYPTPSNLSGNYNWGVLAGLCLVLQIVTGIFLQMHYTAHVDYAFDSVQHLMRDVPNGWMLRYLHQNGQSLFFIVVYMHLFRALYYTSYAQPREQVWLIGVVILLVMILTAFIGYVLPWGKLLVALNDFVQLLNIYFTYLCMKPDFVQFFFFSSFNLQKTNKQTNALTPSERYIPNAFFTPRVAADKRIGPHRFEVLCFIYACLMGDAHAVVHQNGVRITFHQSSKNIQYLYYLRDTLGQYGYCNADKEFKLKKQIYKNGKVYYSTKFHTFTFGSFIPLYNDWYVNKIKYVPSNLSLFFNEFFLAVWLCDDGTIKSGGGLLLCCDCFTPEELQKVCDLFKSKYNITQTLQCREGKYWRIYVHKASFGTYQALVKDFVPQTMQYKLAQ